jgi:hypothetical protein
MTFEGDWTPYVAKHPDDTAKVTDWPPVPRKGDPDDARLLMKQKGLETETLIP